MCKDLPKEASRVLLYDVYIAKVLRVFRAQGNYHCPSLAPTGIVTSAA